MKKIKIGIVDDCESLRISVCNTLEEQVDFEVTLQASNGQELINLLEHSQPDIVLMDIQMPIMDGIEASAKVREKFPRVKVIAFSLYDNESNIIKMNMNGVKSFIGKDDGVSELVEAIRVVSRDRVYMTSYAARIIQECLTISNNDFTPVLTTLDRKLLKLVCIGKSSVEIGRIMNKSHRTIEDHRTSLYKKFKVKTKEELIVAAAKSKLV